MIYVVANSVYEAAAFAMYAHLGSSVRIFEEARAADGCLLTEDDEVFVLANAAADLKRVMRNNHDKAWPRPHVYKEVNYEREEARL